MGIKRAGYYRWMSRKDTENPYELNRKQIGIFIHEIHHKHHSYGYRTIAQTIRDQHGWMISDLLVHKCAKHLGIRSWARH